MLQPPGPTGTAVAARAASAASAGRRRRLLEAERVAQVPVPGSRRPVAWGSPGGRHEPNRAVAISTMPVPHQGMVSDTCVYEKSW